MRRLADRERVVRLMRELGAAASAPARVYFTGGASAVLVGWRSSTIDVDLRFEPERDELLRALPLLKEKLELNIELASPDHFIPELPGWRERSAWVAQEGKIVFLHYDFYAQALAKLERGHAQDLADVGEMAGLGLIDPAAVARYFAEIEPALYRYPAIDPRSFRRRVESFVGVAPGG
jgi:hypothetical protein